MTQLASMANQANNVKLLERALAESDARLKQALAQANDLSARVATAYQKRAEQQQQLAALPPQERAFMQTAHEMLQQKVCVKQDQQRY